MTIFGDSGEAEQRMEADRHGDVALPARELGGSPGARSPSTLPPAPHSDAGQEGVTGLRAEVRRIWNSVLPAGTLDDNRGFFESGGSSMDMLKLLSLFNIRFPDVFRLIDLYEKPTIDLQIRHVLAAAGISTDQARPHLSARQRLAEMRRESRGEQFDIGSDAR